MKPRVYFDYAATSPVREEAAVAMAAADTQWKYNPSSLHAEGRAARAALDDARERIAAALGAHPREIVFTSGGTEANNLALDGNVARIASTLCTLSRRRSSTQPFCARLPN